MHGQQSPPNMSITYSSGASGPVDLRFLHYNDVYHIEPGSKEPVGGAARFVTLVNNYRNGEEFKDQPKLFTFFSGDAFNPSLESSVTKGKHMFPILNEIQTDIACLGNHDLDFGVEQFMYLASKCKFPWVVSNVIDPAIGGPVGGLQPTAMLESSNGFKIGVIGIVEREWLDTINSLPPNLQFQSPSVTIKELIPKLREEGADIIIAVSHQRELNDMKVAKEIPEGLVDIILGGHDHFYGHQIINGVHIIRSGSDFKQLSYIEARRKGTDGSIPGWHFDITRRDLTREIPEDIPTLHLVEKLTAGLKAKLQKPIGFTSVPLDARFTTVRAGESNIGNFVCDLMRFYYSTDCTIMAAGTIRGDQIYTPGVLKLHDIVQCFPFEDPVVALKLPGSAIVAALENGVAKVPALEGRFPQVSNIYFTYDPDLPPGNRVLSCKIGEEDIIPDKLYTLTTRGYMARGKDGFVSLIPGQNSVEEVVDEENGVLISMIVRQYFLSLKTIGKWRQGIAIRQFFGGLKRRMTITGELSNEHQDEDEPNNEEDSDDEYDAAQTEGLVVEDKLLDLVRRMGRKWARLAKVGSNRHTPEYTVDWTRSVAPKVEGRIKVVKTQQ